ncbi:hypothetical protein GRJ2_003190900 [Grus japonensis]|uniref:Uncharacterized protein n=1 Tax=Grus japonensis TaxID=30415 RepID=A0ABC9YB66_GRUJA
MVRQAVPLQPMEVDGGTDIHLQPVEDPKLEQVETPEGGCDPMGRPRWSKLLAGPVDPWRERGHHARKKKYTKKSVCLVEDDDDEPGPSREQEEEPEPEVITRPLSLSELRDMRKDFSCLPGEHIITWLLRCWDNGASSLELEGREAK